MTGKCVTPNTKIIPFLCSSLQMRKLNKDFCIVVVNLNRFKILPFTMESPEELLWSIRRCPKVDARGEDLNTQSVKVIMSE